MGGRPVNWHPRHRGGFEVPIAEQDYLIAHKTKQSSAVAQAYGSAYPARNMLENQLAALACEDWGDFRT